MNAVIPLYIARNNGITAVILPSLFNSPPRAIFCNSLLCLSVSEKFFAAIIVPAAAPFAVDKAVISAHMASTSKLSGTKPPCLASILSTNVVLSAASLISLGSISTLDCVKYLPFLFITYYTCRSYMK